MRRMVSPSTAGVALGFANRRRATGLHDHNRTGGNPVYVWKGDGPLPIRVVRIGRLELADMHLRATRGRAMPVKRAGS